MCDPKANSFAFIMGNKLRDKVKCFWPSIQEMEAGSSCKLHGDRDSGCFVQRGVDLLVGCSPCQPFSKMRHNKGRTCTDHKFFAVTFGEEGSLISLVSKVLPKIFMVEQVFAFNDNFRDLEGTPLSKFMTSVLSITNESGEPHFTGHTALHLDSSVWIDAARGRIPIFSQSFPYQVWCPLLCFPHLISHLG